MKKESCKLRHNCVIVPEVCLYDSLLFVYFNDIIEKCDNVYFNDIIEKCDNSGQTNTLG